MIVSEEEALLRINSPNNLTHKLYEIRRLNGHLQGPKGIPPMVQALAVTVAKTSTQAIAGEIFGVDQSQVSRYASGAGMSQESKDTVKKAIDVVHEQALDSMLECITRIKPKLENVKKATELSSIASNLARVVEKTTPKDNSVSTNVKVIVYAPRSKGEEEYEAIAV